MKVTIDFDRKEIIIDKPVELHILIEKLENLLPHNEWREYILKIEKHEMIIEKQPYIWPTFPQWPSPYDWSQPIIISYDNSNTNYKDIE